MVTGQRRARTTCEHGQIILKAGPHPNLTCGSLCLFLSANLIALGLIVVDEERRFQTNRHQSFQT